MNVFISYSLGCFSRHEAFSFKNIWPQAMLFGVKKQMKNTGELNIFPYVLLNVECEIAY